MWGLRTRGHHLRKRDRAIPTCVGTTLDPGRPPLGCRAIPTCVGTTQKPDRPPPPPPGHPHVCGDYGRSNLGQGALDGPSPRVWGLRLPLARGRSGARAIPTCVGTTPPGRTACRGGRAIPTCVGTTRPSPGGSPLPAGHPHVCGDYSTGGRRKNAKSGPSPRVWGLREGPGGGTLPFRAIPTCVGTTLDQDGENARSPPVMCLFGRSSGKRFSSSAAPGEGVRVGRLGHLTTRASRARRVMLRAMRAKAMRA